MGADGGVVYISLKKPSMEKYSRVVELISPFWQFLSKDDCSNIGQESNYEWERNNSIGPPEFILGYYGTDRCDNFDLGDLPLVCTVTDDWKGYLHSLTFDELDLSCRTSPIPITGAYEEHILEQLWYEHFRFMPREEVLERFGPLSSMAVEDWANEIEDLLNLNRVFLNETWT